MKLFKLSLAAAAALVGISTSSFTTNSHKAQKAFAISYYWYSVQGGAFTGNFKTKATLATEAGTLYTINNNGHARFRYGFAKTITNNPTTPRVYTLFVK